MEANKIYRIKVATYMTKKSKPDFDFMKKFNNDKPMPKEVMTGTIVKEMTNLVVMKLWDGDITWEGYIVKSAILKAIDITEPINENVRVAVEYGKTVVDLGNNPEIRERAAFLLERFSMKDANGSKLYFSALDYEDVKNELEVMNIPVEANPGNFFESLLVKEDDVLEINPPALNTLTASTLYPYQQEGILYGLQRKSFLLADDMGLGKTIQASLIAAGFKEMFGFKHCLVVCGVNSVKYGWLNEVEKHTKHKGFVLADEGAKKIKQLQCLGRALYSEVALAGMGKRDRKEAETSNAINETYYIIVNIEAFRNKTFAGLVDTLCKNGQINGIIFDEIHKCVNVKSQQAQNMLDIKAQFKIGITGTPLVNRPSDAYFTFAWLERTKLDIWRWNNVYQRKTGPYSYENRNMGLLRKNFERIMLRRKKEDVLKDLPEKVYIDKYIDMNDSQKELYKIVENAKIKKNDDKKNNVTLPKIIRKRQVTGTPGVAAGCFPEASSFLSASSAKLEELAELVSQIVENKRKVVIFSNWMEPLNELERYGIINVLRVDSSVTPTERHEIEELWQSEPEGGHIEHPIIVGTIESMGTGMNLQTATNVIFIDEPWTDAKKEQAVDRCHRVGTKDTVNVITLMCRGTIDEDVHDVVLGKKTMQQVLIEHEEEDISEELLALDGLIGEEISAEVVEDYELELMLSQ